MLQAEKLAVIGRFARTIVHDFKNPLNVIGLATEMIGMCADNADASQNSVDRIERQVKRMSNMLTELLEFCRGDSQTVVFSSHNYASFIRELLEDVIMDAKEKGVEITLKNDPPDVNLQVDPPRLTHLVINLIHNAVDAMPGGGKITISFEESPERVITNIQDSGPGIAPEISTKLFEPFATHGKAHGTGLGLSICKKIAEDHGGRIWVHSFRGRCAVLILDPAESGGLIATRRSRRSPAAPWPFRCPTSSAPANAPGICARVCSHRSADSANRCRPW